MPNEESTTTKAKPEITAVKMNDSRTVDFVGKRQMIKSSTLDESTNKYLATWSEPGNRPEPFSPSS